MPDPAPGADPKPGARVRRAVRAGRSSDSWVGTVLDGPPARWPASIGEQAIARGRTVFVDWDGPGYSAEACEPHEVEVIGRA